jgi:uncharacterized protein
MPETASPRQVFERLVYGIAAREYASLHELYADDTVVEHPFGLPERTSWKGKDALREHFAAGAERPLELEVHNVVVHETTDPEVIVGEYDYHGRVTTNGRRFQVHNVLVMRIRDGKIVESRDYHDHARMAAAFGVLPEFVERIKS